MKLFSFQISLILVILMVVGCHRPPEFPETPHISFERLHLTDTATLILKFKVRDGDGDIGLASENEDVSDSFEPYHSFGIVVADDEIVTLSGDYEGPFNIVPSALLPTTYTLFRGLDINGQQIFENETVLAPFRVGDEVPFSDIDTRPNGGYDCEDYEIMSFYYVEREVEDGFILSEDLVEVVDTIYVERNPFHLNIYIDLLIKDGDQYVPFEFEECDPGYSSRFPIFERSDIGRAIEGDITYAFFSTQFLTESSFLLNETLRLRFYIYDRALNQSNVVTTEDFSILGLRNGDLVAD